MNQRIIIVDHDAKNIELYKKTFEPAAAKIVSGNLALAVQPIEKIEFNCHSESAKALLAVQESIKNNMPFAGGFFDLDFAGDEGVELLHKIRQVDPNLLFIVVTSDPEKKLPLLNAKFGAEFAYHLDFLVRPCLQAAVIQKTHRMISSWDRRQRERSNLRQIEMKEDQLMKTERLSAIGSLARGLGHEFGNMLQIIINKAEMALYKKSPEAMEEALKSIITTSEKAGIIVRNLQSMVKIEGGKEKLNLTVPIKEAAELIDYEMKKNKVKFVTEYDGPLPDITMNRFELNQVFLNLMVNAVQAMEKKGGELKIKTLQDSAGISVLISDNGVGIPPENLTKIFEALFTTKVGHGTGVGLTVTRKAVENHGGKISVESKVGTGTTFTIWLPKK